MKKLLTLTLAFAALAVLTDLSVAWQTDKQKSPPKSVETKPAPTKTPVPQGERTIKTSHSNSYRVAPKVMTGEVTKVNEKEKTFVVTANGKEVNFSARELKALPAVGETIDITYNQTAGGPLVAAAVKSSKSNSSERVAEDKGSPRVMTGKVTRVNKEAKTFTIVTKGEEVTFDGQELKALPEVGKVLDITYTQTTPGGPLKSINLNSSRSNIY